MTSPRAPYFPFYPEDFMHGCRMAGMKPDQVGAYIYMLCLEWLNKGPIDEDMRKIAMGMGWDVRIVKRLVNEVVELGKFDRSEGRLSNERMEEEIAKFCRKMRGRENRSAAQLGDSYGATNGQLPGSYAIANGVANEHLSRKDNEINVNAEKQGRDTRAQETEPETEVEKKDNPPTPQGGKAEPDDFHLDGEPASIGKRSAKRKADKAIAEARRRAAHEAMSLFNKAAKHFGFQGCSEGSTTEQRLKRLEDRLDDIGGLENFRRALRSIGKDDFLMGRIQKPGQKPFRLTFDRLMSTGSAMGDVLARLLDDAEASAAGDEQGGLRPNWWRGKEDAARRYDQDWWRHIIAKHANGTWPVDLLGPGPWDEACLVPAGLRAELSLSAKYPSSDGRCAGHH